TGVEGLYMAGGSVHPGPGVAMVALSGRRAAERVYADLPSTQRSRQAATFGTTSTA
ncbi:MAG: CrtD protein, partial [Myxococcota bacterium]